MKTPERERPPLPALLPPTEPGSRRAIVRALAGMMLALYDPTLELVEDEDARSDLPAGIDAGPGAQRRIA